MPTDRHLSAVTPTTDERTEIDASYPDRFLECRALQHRWVTVGFYHANGEIVRSVTCERCSTDRHDHWSPRGARLRATYDHTDGYLIHGGGRTSAHEVRHEVLNRVTVYDSAEAMTAALFGTKRGKRSTG